MKKVSLAILRLCLISVLLLMFTQGNLSSVSGDYVERPLQGRIVVDVPDVTQYYHQEAYEIINPATDHTSPSYMDYASLLFLNPNRIDSHDVSCFFKMHWGLYFEVDQGSYNIVTETGKNGDVSGTFSFHARTTDRLLNDLEWNFDTEGFEEMHEISVEGEIYSGKAVYNSDGFLRVRSNEDTCNGSCGTVKVTYTFNSLGCGNYLDERITSDSISYTLDIDDFMLETNFADESIFKVVSMADSVNESFVAFLMNDPNSNLSLMGLDFSDQGNENDVPYYQESYNDYSEQEQPQLEQAMDLEDNPYAAFSLNLGCDDAIAAGQDIDCSLSIQHEEELISPMLVMWVMDGFIVSEEEVLGNFSSFHFPNPPPGTHTVEVQVVDSETWDIRVSSVYVEVGGFASPEELPDRIPAGAQTGAAAGTTALIAAWLWAEWRQAKANALVEDRRDTKEAKERQAWYEAQMDRNDEIKSRQQAVEASQQALEAEWKRYRNGLLDTVKKHEKSEYLVDLLDDMQPDACRNGKWDAKALQRLQGLIDTHLAMDRQHEVQSEWKRMWNFYKRQEAEANSILRGNAMTGAEIVTGLLTGGASDLIFMPTKAIVSAVYARRRAMMLGKTGWDAAKSIIKESGSTLLQDYAAGKIIGGVVNKVISGGAVLGRKIISAESAEALSKWWQRTGTKLGIIPKPAKRLPVIRQNWGQGPRVYLDRPIYRPGNNIPIGVGFENGLERIGRINGALANDVRRIIGAGARVDPHINNVLSPGNSSYSITAQDEIAVSLMNNPSYKQAVRDGLIPTRVQQVVYQTRDKIAKNATMEAFQALDTIDLNGKAASSYVRNVTVSGTGARPLNPRAVGRYTDWDATVIAADSELAGSAGRQAEELFSAQFNASLRRAGINVDTAEINMFSGVHADPHTPVAGGYSSEGLTHWHKVDMVYQGKSAVRLEDGGVMFDAHPDVEPMTGFGPMEAAPRFPVSSGDVTADARRLIECHINQRIQESGNVPDSLSILRMEGKHAARVWKATQTGSGSEMPDWMVKVMRLKTDPNYHLSGSELDEVWQNYTDYMGLSSNIGGEG